MHAVLQFVLHHGYGLLFAWVLVEQIGIPIPSVPLLLAMGALARDHKFSFGVALALALLATLMDDVVWYQLGRVRGSSVLRLICRISLEPESCVSDTKRLFSRLGGSALVIAKFVPGLSIAAPPMAGLTRMKPWRFLALDGAGALLWSGAYLTTGFLFSSQLERAAENAAQFGSWFLTLLILAFTGYAGWKYYQRRKFIRNLHVDRIPPVELLRRIEAGEEITVMDLRHAIEIERGGLKIRGAIWMEAKELEERHLEIPRDRDIILYCS